MKNTITLFYFLLFTTLLTSQSYLHKATTSNTNGSKTTMKLAANTSDCIIVTRIMIEVNAVKSLKRLLTREHTFSVWFMPENFRL